MTVKEFYEFCKEKGIDDYAVILANEHSVYNLDEKHIDEIDHEKKSLMLCAE